ncbi:type II and III secretion system protein family protein [Parvibaculum sedimenti]|uniref:Type II and III secretion system protein family protein n=2 Tax=Parvibaculum sedimenti TaxID=2608632 RepID=A0A6N6VGS3_9HYPH|nr:type II and III secretion system protein family protein [Parvibaculum sedimenti]
MQLMMRSDRTGRTRRETADRGMQMMSALSIGLFLVLFAVSLTVHSGRAYAAETATQGSVVVEADKAKLIHLAAPAATVFVANPDVADIQVPDPQTVVVLGKRAGATTVYVFDGAGKATGYSVLVRHQTGDAAADIRRNVPDANVAVSSTPKGIIVNGSVTSPLDANRMKAISSQYLGPKEQVILNAGVTSSTQVNLRVRVAEVSRDAQKEFGFNWDALYNNGKLAIGLLTGRAPASAFGTFTRDTSSNNLDSLGVGYKNGNWNVAALIDALREEGLVSILAEPNLTTTSGEPANFLAGGEFPVPVSQGTLSSSAITIEWKRYGVSVDFTPTVLNGNRISVKVRPEVSELSTNGAVTLNDITIPAVTVRRAETTVELASGQSFAIAGLFQNNVQNEVRDFPWLADIPVLGALFRSTSFQRHESELVIIVTPYIVQPVSNPDALGLPTDGLVYASDLEQLLLGRLTAVKAGTPTPASPNQPHLNGAAGFIVE